METLVQWGMSEREDYAHLVAEQKRAEEVLQQRVRDRNLPLENARRNAREREEFRAASVDEKLNILYDMLTGRKWF